MDAAREHGRGGNAARTRASPKPPPKRAMRSAEHAEQTRARDGDARRAQPTSGAASTRALSADREPRGAAGGGG